jgi:hypothetical protein
LRPQPLHDRAHPRAAQPRLAARVGKRRCRKSARLHLERQRLQFLGPAAHDLAESEIHGAAYSITPSAIFSRSAQ